MANFSTIAIYAARFDILAAILLQKTCFNLLLLVFEEEAVAEELKDAC